MISMTAEIARACNRDKAFSNFIVDSVGLFKTQHWGRLGKNEWRANDEAAKNGGSIRARYVFDSTKGEAIYIAKDESGKISILFVDE